jgi:hypothetical protein
VLLCSSSFLSKLNFHRKGAKSAERSGFSLAGERNGKRKGPAAKRDEVDLMAVPFSFPLSQRKAEKNQALRPLRLCGGFDSRNTWFEDAHAHEVEDIQVRSPKG